MVAPTISSPVCQEQLVEAGRLVAKAVEGCVSASQAATEDGQLLRGVGAAATAVTQALNELLQHVKAHATGAGPAGRYDQATDTILTVTENIFSSMGDAGKSTHLQEDKSPRVGTPRPLDIYLTDLATQPLRISTVAFSYSSCVSLGSLLNGEPPLPIGKAERNTSLVLSSLEYLQKDTRLCPAVGGTLHG